MPYAAALEHFYTEPEPDHIYRAMRDLARFWPVVVRPGADRPRV